MQSYANVCCPLRSELQATVQEGADRTGTVHLDQTAVGRISRIDALQQQQMAQAEQRRAERRLIQIGRALKALDDETYGECVRCGDDIPLKRLHARPESPFCIGCATTLGA